MSTIAYSGLARMVLPREGCTLPANYQEVFDALPEGVYVKCSECRHLHTDCDVTVHTEPNGQRFLCELCTKGIRCGATT